MLLKNSFQLSIYFFVEQEGKVLQIKINRLMVMKRTGLRIYIYCSELERFWYMYINTYSCFQPYNQIRAKIVVFLAAQMRIMWQLGKNFILALQMTIYRARIEFLPSYHMIYKNKNNIHDRFVEAQPNSLQLEGGKNEIFVPSREAARVKISHFCLPTSFTSAFGRQK